MKKIIGFTTLVLFATSFTSCKKDYNCTCTTGTGTTATSYSMILENYKKKDAVAACRAKGGNSSAGSVTVSRVCSID